VCVLHFLDRNPLILLNLLVSAVRWAVPILAALIATPASTRADIPVVDLSGVVHPVSAGFVVSAIQKADADHAPLLVLRLDTPGGLDTSMRQIIEAILHSATPVAAFVGPSGARADSAGFLITIVSDVAAMAPGTSTGAAHPVAGMGDMDETMSKKVTSAIAAFLRSKVERRGRNVDMAEKAVVESKSFTEKEALDAHLIDLVVPDVPALIKALDGREVKRFDGSSATLRLAGQTTVAVQMSGRQAFLSLIARPEVLFLLLLGALAGIGAELTHPGTLFPGILGVFCLILFLFATQIIPINAAGAALIVLSVALFAAEAKFHSYGLLTTSGIAAMVLGAMMLVDAPIREMRIPLQLLATSAITMATGTFLLVRLVIQAQSRRAATGEEGMLGQPAIAETALDPEGWVRACGERWKAVAEAPAAVGDKMVIVSVEGLTLHVRRS
jgi:membrane-bound serine protease (ClpP class)